MPPAYLPDGLVCHCLLEFARLQGTCLVLAVVLPPRLASRQAVRRSAGGMTSFATSALLDLRAGWDGTRLMRMDRIRVVGGPASEQWHTPIG